MVARGMRDVLTFAPGTLQELVAPRTIDYYGAAWTHFGTNSLLASEISKITGINIEILRKERQLKNVCIARRMS